jgi:gliding motility-associated-like protein
MVVTSGTGCADSVSKTFAISGYPVVDFKILTTDFCGNLPLQLQDSSGVAYAKLSNLTIFWNYPSTADSTIINNPVPGAVYTYNYPTFGYTNSKQVTVEVRALSSGGCFTTNTSNSILFASPKLVFSAIPTFCANNSQPVLLNEATDTTAFAGSGFYTGSGVNNGYFTPSAAGAGSHTITYNYTLVNGCSDSVQQTVTVAVQPTVSAGQSAIILQGGQYVLQGAASGGDSLTYTWSPGSTLNDSTILQPVAIPATDTYYTLTATNSAGCSDTAGVLIKVLQQPLVPNVFSPNGDGINDTWQIAYLSSYPDCIVEIFNRYGQLLFRSQGYQTPWDGNYNGKPLPVGTYYYIITTSHLPKPLSGPVTILR